MRYRALFVAGPLDGQERVLDEFREEVYARFPVDCIQIQASRFQTKIAAKAMVTVVYKLRRYVGPATLLYSLFDFDETFKRLWSRYIGEDHA